MKLILFYDGQEIFYDTITPVNTFRILFNNYFGDNFEILEDKMYFAEQEEPWNFIEITEIVIEN